MAGRVGVPLSLDDWDRFGRDVPTLVDLKPSGRFLMEDFYYAGGLPAVLAQIEDLLRLDAITVTGRTLGERDLLHRDAMTVNGAAAGRR